MSETFYSHKGIINVIKPTAMTSRDVVSWLKSILNCKKAGHTGTLDPLASGVLPVCINRATKVIPYLPEQKKEYIGEMTLGITTNTLDREGEIEKKDDGWKNLTTERIINEFTKFSGEIKQIPPMFSAIKNKGKPIYKLARKNKKIEREPRQVKIFSLKIYEITLPYIRFKVECSRGTYIRSLVRDIGKNLETGAHLSFLVRTGSGPFNIQDGYTLKDIIKKYENKDCEKIILSIDNFLEYPEIMVKEKDRIRAINGNYLFKKHIKDRNKIRNLNQGDRISVFDYKNQFLAIYKVDFSSGELIFKAERVFS